MKPEFITFTGADDRTPIAGMHALSKRYPIEWGILFSPKRQGTGRYPSIEFVARLAAAQQARSAPMLMSAHMCGGHARNILAHGACEIDALLDSRDLFTRAQINSTSLDTVAVDQAKAWAERLGRMPILQCRGAFPNDDRVEWLFDRSGGRGESPTSWPRGAEHPFRMMRIGYAGGIGPDNAAEVVDNLPHNGQRYWIDMEAKVRDEGDRFDLGRCEAVCRAVYGQRRI